MSATELKEKLHIYNALSGKVEPFRPLRPPEVGLYVCGPTVYGEVHIGNIRTFLSFDILQRFLTYIGYKLHYVRNITDVGHLTEEATETGEDKVEEAARSMRLNPIQLTEYYTRRFHEAMAAFGIMPPHIEPRATAHIAEQVTLIQQLLKAGYAYEAEGSVYFDLPAYEKAYPYGELSGRRTEALYTQTRVLTGQSAKRHALDFALWKKAAPDRLMQWPSPWGQGLPGWHLECSSMAHKYLGTQFDIHGGGMDLKFPHHECELAQSRAAYGKTPARYWMYANMLTVKGEKMSKSAGNILTFQDLKAGEHPLIPKVYVPMVWRFLMLQTHYGSPLDLSAEAIEAAQRGYMRLMNGLRIIKTLSYSSDSTSEDKTQQAEVEAACSACAAAMCQDLNTALALGALFTLLKKINALYSGRLSFGALGERHFLQLQRTYVDYVEQILGLGPPAGPSGPHLMKELLIIYKEAKRKQAYWLVDKIRAVLRSSGISLQDQTTGEIDWRYTE